MIADREDKLSYLQQVTRNIVDVDARVEMWKEGWRAGGGIL